MATGLLKEVIREFIRRRNRLKASERMAEALAIHVAGMMISAEQRRRPPSSFEERMRMLAEEKEKESEKQKKVIVMILCLIDKCGLSHFCWHACVYNVDCNYPGLIGAYFMVWQIQWAFALMIKGLKNLWITICGGYAHVIALALLHNMTERRVEAAWRWDWGAEAQTEREGGSCSTCQEGLEWDITRY